MQCKVINLFISKSIFLLILLHIIIIIWFAIIIMIRHGVLCADQIVSKEDEGKIKKKSKTTRFHIHTDNQIDELSNR
jgi:hypothetical protein